MLEAMLTQRRHVIGAKKLALVFPNDYLTKTAVYPVYGKSDSTVYLTDNAGNTYTSPLTGLEAGLEFKAKVSGQPVIGNLTSIAPYRPSYGDFMFSPAQPSGNHLFTLSAQGVVKDLGMDMLAGFTYNFGMGQVVVNDVLYTFGGYTQQTPVPTMAVYRTTGGVPVLDSTGTLPAPRAYGAFAVDGTDIYTVGGTLTPVNNTYPVSDELWRYSTLTHTWTKLASCPQTLRLAGHCEIINGKLCVFGGLATGDVSSPSQTLYIYNIQSDTWVAHPFPEIGPRYAMMGFQHQGKLYLFGGWKFVSGKTVRSDELWEISI